MCDDVVWETVDIDGVKLNIIADRSEKGEWFLEVENVFGIRSVWNEVFPTAESAVNAAKKAIEEEGPGAFLDTEGFEYLFGIWKA